jgi:hypothetical protein
MLISITLLYAFVFLMAVTSLWVLIKSSRSSFLFFYIPALICLVAGSIFVYSSILGYPRKADLPEEFALLQFQIEENKAIYLWVLPKKETIPISFEIPYTPEKHKELDKVREAVKKGTARGDQKKVTSKKKTNSTETSREDNLQFYDFTELKMRDKEENKE